MLVMFPFVPVVRLVIFNCGQQPKELNNLIIFNSWGGEFKVVFKAHTRPLEKAKKAACVYQSDRGPKEKEKHGSLATADIVRAVAKNVGQID